MHVTFEKHGVTREVKVGFSWTTFLLGGLPQIFTRGEWVVGLLIFVSSIFLSWIPALVYAFFANKRTARRLLEQGWMVVNAENHHIALAVNRWKVA